MAIRGTRRVAARRRGRVPISAARQPSWRRWFTLVAGLAFVAAGLWFALSCRDPSRPPVRSARGDGGEASGKEPRPAQGRQGATRRPTPPKQGSGGTPLPRPAGQLALVIDDLGRSVEEIDELGALGVPLSYSVLPFEVLTADVVARLGAERREILCHLPMQPRNGKDPGPGALVEGMELDALAAATRNALAQVPGAVGANNHMGSGLTTDSAAMGTVLDVLQRHGLFFLDSRTSPDSVGYTLARSLGLPTAQRDVFLDDDPDPVAIRRELARFLERSRENGAAIAIAHPRPTTLEVLREELPKAKEAGFTFVPVSFLLTRTGDPL